MFAELHGKFDARHPETADRSEDLLTSAVFGALRHLPRAAVVALCGAVGVPVDPHAARGARVLLWPQVPMPKWPGKVIEPDVLIVVGKQPVVFEAKLHSPFGYYLEPNAPTEPQLHQLAVQYAAVCAWAAGERLLPPVIVAVTAPQQRPTTDLDRAAHDVLRLCPGTDARVFRWLPWWRIAEVLSHLPELRPHERTLVDDVLAYMEMRGVRRVFNGFKPEDYWLVSAAQRVAGERVYPQVQNFVEDLAAVLDDDGIGWSQPSYRSMWLPLGASTSKPTDWTRGWVGVEFWPKEWPKRHGKLGSHLSLYMLFDFLDPALEVGLSIPGPGVAAAQVHWQDLLAKLVVALRELPAGYELVVDPGDVSRPTRVQDAATVDEDWFSGTISVLTTTAHLRLRRRVDPLQATVQQARELMLGLRDELNAIGDVWWDLVRAVGYLAPGGEHPS
ncbi:hypothetical protein [Modestobacter sp. KNN46-3]|uniref:hypothetical protein n=1 Tax=Modestobacter sp. KNN46-3 TaxID=2711218 RepID=UPI0013DFB0CA|nr:hypothetical protein [Modestobacter sp. KNN46-3]